MILSPQGGGFPIVNEARSAGGSFYLPLEASVPEDGSPGFEKIFAEFLAGVEQRERETERVREARDREEAGAQAWKARETGGPAAAPRETNALQEAEAPRETEAPDEDETPREVEALRQAAAPREDEALREFDVLREAGIPREGEIAWEILVQGEAPHSALAVSAETTEGGPGELRLAGDLEGESALGDRITEAPGGRRGRPGPAELHSEGKTLSPGGELSPAGKDGKGKRSAGERPGKEKAPGEESPVLREIPQAPEGSAMTGKAAPGDQAAGSSAAGSSAAGSSAAGSSAEIREGALAGGRAPGEPAAAGGPLFPAGGEELGGDLSLSAFALRPAPEQETENSRGDRGNGRRKVELRDHRERALRGAGSSESAGQSLGQSPGQAAAPSLGHPSGQGSGLSSGELPLESALELSTGTLSRDSPQTDLNVPSAGASGGTFEEVLARELRQNLNSDIVRHAQLILREGREGTIRLSLRPETLGNVKIRLELTENRIAGRIIVESDEALRAFEREIASLEQAFRDSGYESADLLLSQDGSGGGREEGKPFYSPRLAGERARYDEIVERTDASFLGLPENGLGPGNGHIQVNMLI